MTQLDPNSPLMTVVGLGALKGVHERKGKTGGVIAAVFFMVAGIALAIGGIAWGLYEVYTFGSSRWDDASPAIILGGGIGGVMFLGGAWSLFNSLRTWKLAVGLYDQGLGVVGNGGVQQVRWDQVTETYQQVTRHYTNGVYTGTTHRYTIVVDGKKTVFDDKLKGVEDLGNAIQNGVSNALFPRFAAAINNGQRVNFGPLGLDREHLYSGNKSLLWSEIKGVKLDRGNISIKKEGGWFSWASVTVPQVPNFFVFYALLRNFTKIE